jgi:hypothetical protein
MGFLQYFYFLNLARKFNVLPLKKSYVFCTPKQGPPMTCELYDVRTHKVYVYCVANFFYREKALVEAPKKRKRKTSMKALHGCIHCTNGMWASWSRGLKASHLQPGVVSSIPEKNRKKCNGDMVMLE